MPLHERQRTFTKSATTDRLFRTSNATNRGDRPLKKFLWLPGRGREPAWQPWRCTKRQQSRQVERRQIQDEQRRIRTDGAVDRRFAEWRILGSLSDKPIWQTHQESTHIGRRYWPDFSGYKTDYARADWYGAVQFAAVQTIRVAASDRAMRTRGWRSNLKGGRVIQYGDDRPCDYNEWWILQFGDEGWFDGGWGAPIPFARMLANEMGPKAEWLVVLPFLQPRDFTYGNKIITLFFVGNKIITYLCRVIKNR